MNYFSHYYVLPSYENIYLTLGSILPDMLRNAKSDFGNLKIEVANEEEVFLTQGIMNHIEVDRKFHNSDFFFDTTKKLAANIRDDHRITMNRYTNFYAHILLELMIDYELIKTNSELLDKFYDLLNGVNFDEIERYFQKWLPSQDVELFWERFEKFRQRQFLRDYNKLSNVIQFSFYVYEKATKRKVIEDELFEFESIIKEDLLPIIQEKNRNLFHQLRQTI